MNISEAFHPSYFQDLAVTTLFGLEELLADELRQIGAKNVKVGNRVVHCKGDQKVVYSACLNLRFAIRVLLYLDEFEANNPDELYANAKKLPWEDFLTPDTSFAINFAIHSEFFTHTMYASLKLKDAIVDRVRDVTGSRPSVDKENPDYQLLLHISDEFVTIYADASGESLHKRGYRDHSVVAPINEALAAAIVKLSGWDGKSPLLDAMCGSGTIPIEAVLQARNIPAQWYRLKFGFQTWKNYDEELWQAIRAEAKEKVVPLAAEIFASDISDESLYAAERNFENARVDDFIRVKKAAFKDLTKPTETGTLIINPPYGERLEPDDINAFYQEIGDTLKQQFTDWDAWIITSNKDALKHLGLRTSKRIKLYNGPLETRLVHYPMYRGSKKQNNE